MAEVKQVETYPKIVEGGKVTDPTTGELLQTYEYHFQLGQTQILKISNLLEAYPFSDGFALVRVYDDDGKMVYRYLGENGKLCADKYFLASAYSGGRALCQTDDDGKVSYREFDGTLAPEKFDAAGAFPYKSPSEAEIKAGMDVSNKLNLYGFGEVTINGKKTIINMMGEYPNGDLTKQEVINRGTQIYNFYSGKLTIAELDKTYMADPKFANYVQRIIVYKYNISMIEYFNSGKSDVEEFKNLLATKSKNLKEFHAIVDDIKKQAAATV